MSNKSILIVEDDPSQAELLRYWLGEAGYAVVLFTTGSSLIRNPQHLQSADLLLLDWNLPDVSGEEVLAWIRNRGFNLPVIFNTVHDFEGDVVAILNAGADDYLIKPSTKSMLLARVQSVLRRSQKADQRAAVLHFPPVTLNRLQQCMLTPAAQLALSDKEFAILWELAVHEGQVLLRKRLLSVVWGYDDRIESRSLDATISRIRKLLKTIDVTNWQIHSVYGAGYRLEIAQHATPS